MDPDEAGRRVGGLLSAMIEWARTALRPRKSLHLSPYDRAIRVVGAIILAAILLGILYTSLTHGPSR